MRVVTIAELGLRLKESREKKGLNQLDVAQLVDTDRSSVTKWEQGEREPSCLRLARLALALALTPNDLLLIDPTSQAVVLADPEGATQDDVHDMRRIRDALARMNFLDQRQGLQGKSVFRTAADLIEQLKDEYEAKVARLPKGAKVDHEELPSAGLVVHAMKGKARAKRTPPAAQIGDEPPAYGKKRKW